jgi:hypothetical protein
MLASLVSSFGTQVSRWHAPLGSAALALALLAGVAPRAEAQAACTTGLCLQQVSCPNGGTTSITGQVFAPNGVDPLPNVLVYIPNAPVVGFPATVGCTVGGVVPSGSPIVGTTTGIDGSFLLANVPVGPNIPVVIQTGRWRRQVTVSTVAACTSNSFSTRFAQTSSEGDIPKIAIATGAEDALECVLRKVGLADSEFTSVSGSGRINLFAGTGAAGATTGASTTSESALMGDRTLLSSYDIVMFPCKGSAYPQTATLQNNLIDYANNGGRVYATHFSYVWLYNDPPFNGTATWNPNQNQLPDGIATIDTSYPNGQTLADWLQNIGATTTNGQIALSTLRHDQSGIVSPPSQSVLTLNTAAKPVMQFTFQTPIGTPAAQQCGKVLFNEYHVENPSVALTGKIFPAECPGGSMSPQEKLLEFSLFDLSGNSVIPTLTPLTQDFGQVPVGITSATQTFTWTNPSPFPVAVSAVNIVGDYAIVSNNCLLSGINAGGSCQIAVDFTPTTTGARAGTLSVTSGLTTLKSTLTGTGVPDIQVSAASLNFGNIDVGGISAAQTVTVSNALPYAVALQPLAVSGDYTYTTTCGASLGSLATCTVTLTFRPTASGARPGSLVISAANSAYGSATTTLTGNGVDFSLVVSPTSGTVVAGFNTSTTGTLTSLGGFNAIVTITCTTNAAGSLCTPALSSGTLSGTLTVPTPITTTARYTVLGYGGLGGGFLLSLFGVGGGALLWAIRRKRGNTLLRACLTVLLLATAGAWTTGCSGKLPDQNNPYTAPGSYTYTMTATDGFLTHSATYSLTVTAK